MHTKINLRIQLEKVRITPKGMLLWTCGRNKLQDVLIINRLKYLYLIMTNSKSVRVCNATITKAWGYPQTLPPLPSNSPRNTPNQCPHSQLFRTNVASPPRLLCAVLVVPPPLAPSHFPHAPSHPPPWLFDQAATSSQ